MDPKDTTALLELIASQSPRLLDPLLENLAHSPARFDLACLAECWSVGLTDLQATVLRAISDVDRLQRRRAGWRRPQDVCRMPNLAAIRDLAAARRHRFTASTWQKRKLEAIQRRAAEAYEDAERKRRILNFLSQDPEPVDLAFLYPLSSEGSRRGQQP